MRQTGLLSKVDEKTEQHNLQHTATITTAATKITLQIVQIKPIVASNESSSSEAMTVTCYEGFHAQMH